jgi:hypothetical protein
MTVGQLFQQSAPVTAATRGEITAKLTALERSLSPLFDSLIAIAKGIEECREMLAADDDDDPAEDDASLEQAAPAESADEVSHGI